MHIIDVLNILNMYSLDLTVALVFIITFLYFVFMIKNHKQYLAHLALELVLQAEDKYGAKTGAIKYAVVVTQLYSYIPLVFKPFVTAELLGDLVEKAVSTLQQVLLAETTTSTAIETPTTTGTVDTPITADTPATPDTTEALLILLQQIQTLLTK